MFAPIEKPQNEEPPASRGALVVERVSQALLFLLCAGPIALFPIALAHRLLMNFLS